MNSIFTRFQRDDYVRLVSRVDRVFRGKVGESNNTGILLWDVEVWSEDESGDLVLDHQSTKVFLPWSYVAYMSEDMKEVSDREFPRTV